MIRPARLADAPALAGIYGHHVLTGLATFEEIPPPAEEMARRLSAVQRLRLPYLVSEEAGVVVGFAYASPFRPRSAYRYTAEDSIYLAPQAIGRGLGRTLLAEIVAACEALGLRQLMAGIGDSANTASIGLHRALGFEAVGTSRAVGFKFGRWVDVVWMQRRLGPGEAEPPSSAGLALGT
ncbi:MAG TPA: GNAT family N-acetyltransferase [Caulobacteraceae bacterium]|nr:GNAT family N-acetyltransferase [Caulobacteraceae bacterium]